MALEIEINGKKQTVDAEEAVTLNVLLTKLELRADRIAVERNGEIVPRSTWGEATVRSGDRLEVVHFVGGGKDTEYPLSDVDDMEAR